MGFLSRKTTPDDGHEQVGAVQTAEPQSVDTNSPLEAEGDQPAVEQATPSPPEPEAPSPPEPDGEEIRVSENGGAPSDVPEVGAAVTAEPEPEEPRRMMPSELIAPTRREMLANSNGAEDEGEQKRAEVFVFANQKGGVAKTTTTLNLAV